MLLFEGERLTLCDRETHVFVPRWLYAYHHPQLMRMRACQEYSSLVDCVRRRGAASLCLQRTYALGDVLMLLPVARSLHRMLGLPRPIRIATKRNFFGQLRPGEDSRVMFTIANPTLEYGCEVNIDLDRCLEKDHVDPAAAGKDRLQLYAEALGCTL